jgi:putative transposase
MRARIVLSSAQGETNSSIAERMGASRPMVGRWRARFIERRISGLYDDARPGNARKQLSGAKIDELTLIPPQE